MRFSHSKVDLFNRCPFHFYVQYVLNADEVKEFSASDPLIIGNALHLGIETKSKEKMVEYYFNQYPVVNDLIVNEAIKLELAYDKVVPVIKGLNIKHQEYVIETERFKGIVDLIVENEDGSVDVFDFKYSNNIDNYNDSYQLHLYKDFLEDKGFKVRKLGYIFVPKTFIRQKKNEDLYQFRKRIVDTYEDLKVTLKEVKYDEMASIYFVNACKKIETQILLPIDVQPRNPNGECYACKYKQDYFQIIEGVDEVMVLPKNVRRELELDLRPDFWIYADSYVGKSTFVDSFEDVLFINTDGNTDNTTSPVVEVKDYLTKEGRIKTRHFGWETFKQVVDDLTTEKNDFKAVAVDLVEDLLELCRSYVFDKNNIEHESDSGFGKGWDLVRKEFIDTMKRLKALKYQLIFISKELRKEVKLKGGTSYTTFSPNINDKYANVLSGVVDLTVHATKDNEDRTLHLITDQYTFGGGRFDFKVATCELDRKAFEEALKEAQGNRKKVEQIKTEDTEKTEETSKRRRRRA